MTETEKVSECNSEVSLIDVIAVKRLMNNSSKYDGKYMRSSSHCI